MTITNRDFSIVLRQIESRKGRYISTFLVALTLALLLCIIGRMNSWLGPNGEGLMDAFSAAPHDIGVQPLEDVDITEIENIIQEYTDITDIYVLAMEDVIVNNTNLTANVIDEPTYFQMIQGESPQAADEIVITEYVASDLNLMGYTNRFRRQIGRAHV